ncbi:MULTISPECIES: hypothetical protein [unclassified Microcoleus]|uniref:hypothetical protein n=1 Tax=unclassified Microcoleus TaxID=2642155 RepID=UPI00312BBA14
MLYFRRIVWDFLRAIAFSWMLQLILATYIDSLPIWSIRIGKQPVAHAAVNNIVSMTLHILTSLGTSENTNF